MARIPQYFSSQGVPSGVSTGAIARPGGDSLGRALQQGGQGLQQSANILKQKEDQKAITEAGKAYAEYKVETAKWLQDAEQNAAPGAEGFTPQVSEYLEQSRTKLLERFDNQEARNWLERNVISHNGSLEVSALKWEASTRVKYKEQNQTEQIDLYANGLMSNPGELRSTLQTYQETLEASGLPPTKQEELREKAENIMSGSAVNGLIDINPWTAEKSLRDGEYDDLLTPSAKATLLGRAEREQDRLERKAKTEQETRQREYLRGFEDHAAYLASGRTPDDTMALYDDETIRDVFADEPEKADELIRQRNRATQFGEDYTTLAAGTPIERQNIYARREAEIMRDESLNFREREKELNNLKAAADRVDQQIADDPALFVARTNDAVIDAGENLANVLGDPEAPLDVRREAHEHLMNTSLEAQTEIGVPLSEQRVFSKGQILSIANNLNERMVSGEGYYAALGQMKEEYGDAWPRVMQEMVQDDVVPSGVTVLDEMAPGPGTKLARFYQSEDTTADMEGRIADASVKKQINADVESAVADLRLSFGPTGDAGQVGDQYRDAIKDLSLIYVTKDKMAPAEAVQKAKSDILGGYEFAPQKNTARTVRLPAGEETDKIMGGAEAILDDPSQLGELEIDSAFISDSGIQQELYYDALSTAGYWVTNGRGDGLVLLDPTQNVVYRADGTRVEMSFSELKSMGLSRAQERARDTQNRFGVQGPASQNLPMGN